MELNNIFKPLARPHISLKRFLFYFATVAILLLIYSKISEFSLLWEIFHRTKLQWLIGITISQLLNYYFLALNYRAVLQVKETDVPVRKLFPVMFVVQFLNQALPSATISGQAFFVQYLKRYGLSLAEGLSRAILELATLYVAFGGFFVTAAGLMIWDGSFRTHPEVLYLVYLFLFFGAAFTWLFVALQKKRRGGILRWALKKLHRYFEEKGHSKKSDSKSHVLVLFEEIRQTLSIKSLKNYSAQFWLACLWQGLELLANVFTLYFVCFAVNAPISLATAFIVFTLTRFVSMVSFIPGAFGIFEGSMTFVLTSFSMPIEIALAATLLFRAFSFWLPIPVGWILYRHYTKEA